MRVTGLFISASLLFHHVVVWFFRGHFENQQLKPISPKSAVKCGYIALPFRVSSLAITLQLNMSVLMNIYLHDVLIFTL